MLELQKFVLLQVSDNETLFKKELQKSKKWLRANETEELLEWLMIRFGSTHKEIIEEVFVLEEV